MNFLLLIFENLHCFFQSQKIDALTTHRIISAQGWRKNIIKNSFENSFKQKSNHSMFIPEIDKENFIFVWIHFFIHRLYYFVIQQTPRWTLSINAINEWNLLFGFQRNPALLPLLIIFIFIISLDEDDRMNVLEHRKQK